MRSVLLLLIIAGALGWFAYRHFQVQPENTLVVYGSLEARNIDVGSKVAGRVTEVLVREGDSVKSGQLLVAFDDAELKARVEQARGRVQWAQANVGKMKSGARVEEIAEARAAADPNSASRGFRSEEVAQARAELERARADAVNAERQVVRARELASKGVASKQFLDDAEDRRAAAVALVRSAEHAIAAAEGRLQAAAAVTMKTERGFRPEELAAAEAELVQAQAALQEAEASWAEHEVRAPADAIVEVLDLQPGDLVSPNAVVAKLLKRDELYAMVYVPETRISAVRLGQRAQISVDAYPGEVFPAQIEQIRQQAEFLPRNVQTLEERIHQVIGVKLRVQEGAERLRPGVSVEVRFPMEPPS